MKTRSMRCVGITNFLIQEVTVSAVTFSVNMLMRCYINGLRLLTNIQGMTCLLDLLDNIDIHISINLFDEKS